MTRENNNYIIYKVINTVNNEVYIGATTTSVRQRQLDHNERANRGESGKFQDAIRTYGTDAFKYEQIFTACSIDELAVKEKQYIIEYKAKEKGYNADSGGGVKKSVFQYSIKDGKLVNTYNCLQDAAKVINATKQNLSNVCLSVNHTYRGFYWSYNYEEPFKPIGDERKKEVLQYALEGYLIAKYVSVSEASKQTGIVKTSIAKVSRGERKTAGGFMWKYY